MILRKNRLTFKLSDDQLYKANEIIKNLINYKKVSDVVWKSQVSYILATIYHETAHTFKPIEEFGKGKGKPYGQKLDINGSKYLGLDHIYYGRGFVQITWLSNYKLAKDKLNIDLVNHPELALDYSVATKIANYGMVYGWFTGKCLNDFINTRQTDFIGARKIINGTDKALQIASYANAFFNSLA